MWRVRSKLQASPTAIVEEANKPKLNGFYVYDLNLHYCPP